MQPLESEDILYWSVDSSCSTEILYSVLNDSSSVWILSNCEYVKQSYSHSAATVGETCAP